MVMGRDSCSEDCGFKSQHHKHGQFLYIDCCTVVEIVYIKDENKQQKEVGDGLFLNHYGIIFERYYASPRIQFGNCNLQLSVC